MIGTLATGAAGPVDVVTGDRDLFQVVDDDGRRPGPLHRPGRRQPRARRQRVDAGEVRRRRGAVRRLRDAARRRFGRTAGRGRASATRPPPPCSTGSATWPGIMAAAEDPDSDLGPGPRGKIKAAADYLAVAPKVVAVARDLDLDRRAWPPVTPRTPARVTELAQRYNLESPAARLVEALTREPADAGRPGRRSYGGDMSRIAVVGGHGQVARHLLVELRRSAHDPVALVRREGIARSWSRAVPRYGCSTSSGPTPRSSPRPSRAATRSCSRPEAARTATRSASAPWTSRAR